MRPATAAHTMKGAAQGQMIEDEICLLGGILRVLLMNRKHAKKTVRHEGRRLIPVYQLGSYMSLRETELGWEGDSQEEFWR
jgi:hypothetical protein